ncbi:MAG: response regulator [Kiritimatiellae bacterium]|nr:response regulator [Kiritimatiellia bacterium]
MFLKTLRKKNDVLHKVRHSIRTRYSLATAFFLLTILGLFYIGGRIVLVHLVKDAETQVREIGTDINRLAIRNAEKVKQYMETLSPEQTTLPINTYLGLFDGNHVALALRLDANGHFVEGFVAEGHSGAALRAKDVASYKKHFPLWVKSCVEKNGRVSAPLSANLLRLRGNSYYVALIRGADGRFLALGMPFDPTRFTAQMNEVFAGMELHVSNGKTEASAVPVTHVGTKTERQQSFGLSSMVSEAFEFYSGGFWKLGENPFEAVYTIRDIAGRPVSRLSVSLPQTFSNAAGAAIGRLTLFVTVVGILLVLPIFWAQSRMLLNPLTKMTECVRQAREHCGEADCPRLDWRGDDEFAELAFSVNALIETISNRTLAIAQVENRQKAMINGMPDGLFIFDRQHRLISVIKQPDGVEPVPGLAEGRPVDVTVFGRPGVDAIGQAIDGVVAGGGVRSVMLDTGSGRHARYFDVRLARMDELFALAIARDATQYRREHARRLAAEVRLSHASKRESLTLLAGSIAHDMNNVLAAINNTVEITWMEETDPLVIDALNTIRDAIRHGTSMTRELMAFAGETKVEFKPMSPSALVHDAHRLVDGIVGEHVTVTYDVADGLPAVDVDIDQMWKVFLNLVKNANEAMGGAGQISISARAFTMTEDLVDDFIASRPLAPGAGVVFQFSDTGPGVTPEFLKRMFDPYVSTKSTGHGLGLATVLSIIDAHHGGIHVTSTLGSGTTFQIFLPASKAVPAGDATDTVADDPTSAAQFAGGAREVLVVDDDVTLLKTTAILLKVLKYRVFTAKGHRDALDIFRRHAPNLSCVVMDANLGETDSVRLLGSFRSIAPNIPVIVSSGYASEKIRVQFASQPYNAFLAKPYTLDEIQKTLESLKTT